MTTLSTARRLRPPGWLIALCAILYILVTTARVGEWPLVRSQEARVLETAREMLVIGTRDAWLQPQLNGEPRLRKPPLCYWYIAESFKYFGVNEWAGRIPTLALGWLAIGVTFLLGRDLGRGERDDRDAGVRFGFLAAVVLGTATFFLRFSRSTETDMPAMLGTILACWCLYRVDRATAFGRSIGWSYLAALGIAFCAMTKGAPFVFPLAFVSLLAMARHTWRPIKRFVWSGAPLLAIALATPWYVYILTRHVSGGGQVGEEVGTLLEGRNHFGLAYHYIPDLFVAMLPWSGFLFLAIPLSVVLWRRAANGRVDATNVTAAADDLEAGKIALLVFAAVAGPLCLTLNNQPHYLVPALPGCALLIAWLLTRMAAGDGRLDEADARWAILTRQIFGITLVCLLCAGPAILGTVYLTRHRIAPLDMVAAAIVSAAGLIPLAGFRSSAAPRQLMALATVMALTMPFIGAIWVPTTASPLNARSLATDIRTRFGDVPLLTFGTEVDISLGYELRAFIDHTTSETRVRSFITEHPDGIVLFISKDSDPKLLPDLLERKAIFKTTAWTACFGRR